MGVLMKETGAYWVLDWPLPPCTERARQGYRAKGSRSRIYCVAVEELCLSYYMGTASIKEV